MTREEAIKMVQAHKFPKPTEEWQMLNNEAIDMAIEALKDRLRGECRTCGRNADNGGVHENGRTKCPIQEHYALLLDGHCHLYEPYKGGDDE